MPNSPQRHWARNLVIVGVLLGLWVGITIGVVWVGIDMADRGGRGAQAYWLAAYGAPTCYLLLAGIYAWLMRTRRS